MPSRRKPAAQNLKPLTRTQWKSSKKRTGHNPTWSELLDEHHDKHRDETAANYWTDVLRKTAKEKGLVKNDAYTDFYAKVLSLPTGIATQVIKDAHEVADKNMEANKASSQYLKDLKDLANGSIVGYNRMAAAHLFADDEVKGQLAVLPMDPAEPARIFLPLSEDVQFGKCSADLKLPGRTQKYFDDTFAEKLKTGLAQYHGKKLTFCIHAATNVPQNWAIEPDKVMMTERFNTLKGNVERVLGVIDSKLQNVSKLDYRFQRLSSDLKHFGSDVLVKKDEKDAWMMWEKQQSGISSCHHWENNTSMAGAVLVIAEEKKQEATSRNKSATANCEIKDFDKLRHLRGPALKELDDRAFEIWERKNKNLLPGKQEKLPESNKFRADFRKYGHLLHAAEERAAASKAEQIKWYNEADKEREYGEYQRQASEEAYYDDHGYPVKQGETVDCNTPLPKTVALQMSTGTGLSGTCVGTKGFHILQETFAFVDEVTATSKCRKHCLSKKTERGASCCELRFDDVGKQRLCQWKGVSEGEDVQIVHDKNSKVKGWCV